MRKPATATAAASSSNTSCKTPCCTKVGLKRGPWTPEEDELLANYINREGEGRWRTLPKRAGLLRCGKSCRLRWMNYLRPSVKRGHIAPDEEDLILRLHRLLGNRWSLIAGRIPGRTDNEIKNYWNTHLSKKLISQGIDPRTHKPLDQPSHSSVDLHRLPANPNPNSNSNLGLEKDGKIYYNQENLNKSDGGIANLDDERDRIDSENLENGDGSGLMMTGFQGGSSHRNSEQGDDLDFCSDDIFSSFLNSLINDDMFTLQQQQQQQQQGEPLLSASGFGYGTLWDSPISAAPGVNHDEHSRGFMDDANK